MPPAMTISPVESVAALISSLRPASQAALLQFAQFLKSREAAEEFAQVDEAEEDEWDKLFSDPGKVANFTRWADESRARSTPQPFDLSRL